jgi:predicted ribosomally synthesized peptide with SipW-like signal peptide
MFSKSNLLIVVVLLLLAVAAYGLMGTSALFSDTETSVDNTFVAGTLDLEIGSHATLPIAVTNVKPGDWGSAWIPLKNVGSVQGQVKFASLTKTLDEDRDCNPPEAAVDGSCGYYVNGELDENLTVVLWDDANSDDIYDVGTETYFFQATGLDGIEATPVWSPSAVITIAPGATIYLKVRWDVLGSVGNIIQSDATAFTLTFDFEQYP